MKALGRKLRYQDLFRIRLWSLADKTNPDIGEELCIKIVIDKKNKSLSIIDSGIGMTEDVATKLSTLDIQQVLTAVINAKTDEAAGESSGQPDHNLQVDIVDEIDEEVIELEFERTVEKIHSHHGYEMYCPNCSTHVTKVVLRLRIVKKTPVKTDKPVVHVRFDNLPLKLGFFLCDENCG